MSGQQSNLFQRLDAFRPPVNFDQSRVKSTRAANTEATMDEIRDTSNEIKDTTNQAKTISSETHEIVKKMAGILEEKNAEDLQGALGVISNLIREKTLTPTNITEIFTEIFTDFQAKADKDKVKILQDELTRTCQGYERQRDEWKDTLQVLKDENTKLKAMNDQMEALRRENIRLQSQNDTLKQYSSEMHTTILNNSNATKENSEMALAELGQARTTMNTINKATKRSNEFLERQEQPKIARTGTEVRTVVNQAPPVNTHFEGVDLATPRNQNILNGKFNEVQRNLTEVVNTGFAKKCWKRQWRV